MGRIRNQPQDFPPVKIGYARVSTSEQDLSVQIDALKRDGVLDKNLYTDKKSGSSMKRRGLEEALLDARPGDVLVVYKLDRLSRSMKDLLNLSERLHNEGIELRSLNDPVDTTSPMGKFYFHLMAALAEFERSLIGWRTKKGMENAKRNGARFGPEPKLLPEQVDEAIKLLKSLPLKERNIEALARKYGVTGQLLRMRILAKTGRKLWRAKKRKPKINR